MVELARVKRDIRAPGQVLRILAGCSYLLASDAHCAAAFALGPSPDRRRSVAPTAKPATCAQNATPPCAASAPIEPTPLKSCIRNQMPRKKIAGISTRSRKKNDEDRRQHARVRVEDEVGAHHAGDRAAGADHRHERVRVDAAWPSAAAAPQPR